MKVRSFHDHHVVGYDVDAEARRITLRLRSPDSKSRATLVFEGVEGYCFKNTALGCIVSDFSEIPIGQLIKENRNEIAESYHTAGAPGTWAADLSAAEKQLQMKGIRAFQLESSFGMSGWVLAANVA